MTDDHDRPRARRLTVIAASAVVLLTVIGVVVALSRQAGDDREPGAGAGAGAGATKFPTPTASPSDAPPPDEAPSADDTEQPGDGGGGSGGSGEDPTSQATGDGAVNAQRPVRVSLSDTAEPADDLVVSVARVEKVTSRAELPGETSRPALRITIEVANRSDEPAAIGGALTNLYYGQDRTAATLVQRPGGRAFPARVAAGSAATSVVVYNVPPRLRGDVVLEVSLDATVRRVEFSGDCSASC